MVDKLQIILHKLRAISSFDSSWQEFFWIAVTLIVVFIVSIIVIITVLVLLPAAYFTDPSHKNTGRRRSSVLLWPFLFLKNVLGAMILATGIVMLFLPGQGLLAILLGIMLLDFPGKRRLERKLIYQPSILTAVNRLRKRFGKAAIIKDE